MTPLEREQHDAARRVAKDIAKAQPSPERKTVEPIPIGFPRPMAELPKKYCDTLEQNQKLNGCCRRMENLTGQYFKTQPEFEQPDLLISACKCGRHHYRLMVGAN